MTNTTSPADLADEIVQRLRTVVGPGRAHLHEPHFAGNERDYVLECIESTFISSVSPFVQRFEDLLREITGAEHAVAVVNGTAALHLSLVLAGVEPGDEVLMPSLSFVATANAAAHAGAVPHFVDVDTRTLGLDPMALREHLEQSTSRVDGVCVNQDTGRVIRAVVPMHTFGHAVQVDALVEVADDFGLVVVEDAAEALGTTYKGRHAGTFGALGTLSFNGNKTVTTGGGGAILTNDGALAARARHLSTTAKVPHRWAFVHDSVGWNYRMPGLNAALGCAQLEQLDGFVQRKRTLVDRYRSAFEGFSAGVIREEEPECHSNYWLQALILEPSAALHRDMILEEVNDAGLGVRPCWTLLHRLAPFSDAPRASTPVSESLERRIINLPSSVFLTPEPVG